jgi:hypothetical protein
VNPDTNLSREAQRRRWRIYNWKRGSRGLTHDGIVAANAKSAETEQKQAVKGVGV